MTHTAPETCDPLCLDLPKAERVRSLQADGDALDGLARRTKALGDATRPSTAHRLTAEPERGHDHGDADGCCCADDREDGGGA